MIYFILTLGFFIVMLLYFKIADHYNIIDHPNGRSSHTEITIRGGGIIFLFAALIILVLHPESWMPILGMLIIGIISFVDDSITLSNRIRLLFHLVAVSLLFLSLNVFQIFPWYICISLYILVIGIINAYNFMDGINGITGLYSLVILAGLQYVNYFVTPFIQPDLIWLPAMACLVFLFFNFRKRAKCFAGDVGSVSIAFIILFFLLQLIMKTGNLNYLLLLLLYGLDTVTTIFFRLIRKENIFDAHRSHFYQYLANERKIPHLVVSSIYALTQMMINTVLIFWMSSSVFIFCLSLCFSTIIFIIMRFSMEGSAKLLGS